MTYYPRSIGLLGPTSSSADAELESLHILKDPGEQRWHLSGPVGTTAAREVVGSRHRLAETRSPLRARVRGYIAESMVRNSAFLVMNLGITTVTSYAALSLITHMYSVEAVGLSAAAMSASSLVVMLTQSGIDYSLPRLLPTSKSRASLVNTVHTGVILATMIGSIIFLATPFANKMFALGGSLFAAIFIVTTCLQGSSSLLEVVLVADRESGKMASANLLPSAVKLAAPPVFTFLGNLGAYIARTIYIAVYFCILVPVLIRRGHRFKFELSGQAAHELGRFSVGMYTSTVVGRLPQMLLPIVVLSRMGALQSAYWSIAMTIGLLLNQLPSVVTQALLPEISLRPTERKRLLLRSAFLVAGIVVPALIVAYIAAPLLLGVFGHSYTPKIISSLRWLIYSGFITMMNYTTGAILFLAKKSSALIFVNVVDAIIVIGMAAVWATSSRDVAIGYFAGDVATTVLFGFFAFLAIRDVGGRFEALGGEQTVSTDMQVLGSLQQAFDLLSSIADQQRLSAVHEVTQNSLTEPQGLYSVLAFQEAEAERHRQRQWRAQPEDPRPPQPQPQLPRPPRPQRPGPRQRPERPHTHRRPPRRHRWWRRIPATEDDRQDPDGHR